MTRLHQLIDDKGTFLSNVGPWIQTNTETVEGLQFSVITVLGCQSSGKSTLLNELFKTDFAVLNASQGRNQTTKGLWIACDSTESLLIIDVEGTDSRERGEDRLTFEHRAALFSLALADIVLVNMWYHDLGRYTASNYGLLKTVFAVNLDLFQQDPKSPKTTLLFVIRDYSASQTPLEVLQNMIYADIRAIWKDIKKPDHLCSSIPEDFFIFQIMALPSQIVDRDNFQQKCGSLKSRLLNELRPSSYTRQIPIDGFPYYAKTIWDTILKSSELDIPSQKEMLATFRCEELRNAAMREILSDLVPWKKQVVDGDLRNTDFRWASKLIEKALGLYDKSANRYQVDIYRKKRSQLLGDIKKEMQEIFDIYLTNLRHAISEKAVESLDRLVTNPIKKEESAQEISETEKTHQRLKIYELFTSISAEWKSAIINQFVSTVAEHLRISYKSNPLNEDDRTKELMTFDSTAAQQFLNEALSSMIIRCSEIQMITFDDVFSAHIYRELECMETYLLETDLTYENYWLKLLDMLKLLKPQLDSMFDQAYFGLNQTADTNSWNTHLNKILGLQIHRRLEALTEWILMHIIKRFQQIFDQDDDGVPRQWQIYKGAQIKELYISARDKALVIPAILDVKPLEKLMIQRGYDSDTINEIMINLKPFSIPQNKLTQIISRANRQMQQKCHEAQLIQATGARGSNIPWWIWVLIFALGYNELTAILFSPLLLILIISAGLVLGVCHQTNQMHIPIQICRQGINFFATSIVPLLDAVQQNPDTRREDQARQISVRQTSISSNRKPSSDTRNEKNPSDHEKIDDSKNTINNIQG